MNNQQLLQHLHPYLDGELEPDVALEVERALADSPDARAELSELRAVQLMARAAVEGPAAEVDLSHMAGDIMARLEAEGALRTVDDRAQDGGVVAWLKALMTFEKPMMSLAMAAALAALVIGAIALNPPSAEEGAAGANVAATAPVAPPIGQRRGPELESGRHAAFVEHVEAAKGRVVVQANTDDPSKPMVLWHHVDDGGALPIDDSPAQEL